MICENCGSQKFKSKKQFNDDERFLIKRIQVDSDFEDDVKDDDMFCKRCYYQLLPEDTNYNENV